MGTMATFKTHLTVAATASAVAGLLITVPFHLKLDELLLLAATGTVGGLLPDLDAPTSRPARLIWTWLAILGALISGWMALTLQRNLLEALLLGLFVYLLMTKPIPTLFHRLTRHRGVFHSLLAVLFWGLMAVHLSSLLGAQAGFAWGVGGFLAFGYLIHLLLDELYSIDLRGKRIKSSFGTAMKPVGEFWPSLLMVILSGWLALQAPPVPEKLGGLHGLGRTVAVEWLTKLRNMVPFGMLPPSIGKKKGPLTS